MEDFKTIFPFTHTINLERQKSGVGRMTIGDQLRKTRLLLGLNQTQMCAGVISESFYSKVERNISEINAMDLIKILNLHHISLYDFFAEFNQTASLNQISETSIIIAYRDRNFDLLEKINKEKNQLNSEYSLELQLINAAQTNKIDRLPSKVKNEVKQMFLQTNHWDTRSIWRLILAMPLYDLKKLNWLLDSIFTNFFKKKKLDDQFIEAVANAAIAYIDKCYRANAFSYAKSAFKFIDKLPASTVIFMPKILSKYYLALFNRDDIEAKKIMHLLKKSGYEDYVNSVPKSH